MFDCLHNSLRNGPRGSVQNQGQQSRKDREELVDDLSDLLAQIRDDSDVDRIEQLLDEIEQLDPAAFPDFDAEQSLNDFYQRYEDLLFNDPSAGGIKKPKHRRSFRAIARTAAIIAAALIVLAGVAQAAGFNIFGIFPWWNNERFHLAQEENETPEVMASSPEIAYSSLQAALDAYGIETPLAPTQLPEGAELQMLTVSNSTDQMVFRAGYALPDGELFITIRQITEAPFSDVEKNVVDVGKHIVNGITHQIMDDEGMQKAVWDNGVWEGYIAGDISREELTAMIDSIYQ